jgi:hypothetical protein
MKENEVVLREYQYSVSELNITIKASVKTIFIYLAGQK